MEKKKQRRAAGARRVLAVAIFFCASVAVHAQVSVSPGNQRGVDQKFSELAKVVPGFGGMFYDSDGTLNIYLVDTSKGEEALAAIPSIFGSQRVKTDKVKILQARYSFAQLQRWYDRLQAQHILALPGVIATDIDERRNRLVVGVADDAARERVRAELRTLSDIPEDAVIVEKMQRVRPAATLRDLVRPVLGGLQIRYSAGLCTLGFNAIGPGGARGFIINSHCTNVQGGVENTVLHQPDQPHAVGVEISDPFYFTGFPCPGGRVCRWSDSALASYDAGIANTIGLIYKTEALGSLTIDETTVFRIIEEAPYPFVGETLDKVGRTTGWTEGEVTATCMTLNVEGTNATLLCQDRVTGAGVIVGGGDSGSPVFVRTASEPNNVVLMGVLWGRNEDDKVFYLSAMENIEFELGSLSTF